jgi:hypothetical protein
VSSCPATCHTSPAQLNLTTPAGDLYLYPGFGLLHRRRGGFMPIDARALELTAGPPADGRGGTLAWHGPAGMLAAYRIEDAAAAQAFCAAFATYRERLEQLASHAGPAPWPAGAAGPGVPPITVVPPPAELRLRLFPAADLAVLAPAGLAVLLLTSPPLEAPSGLPAFAGQAQLAFERLMAGAAGFLAVAADGTGQEAVQAADPAGSLPGAASITASAPSVARSSALVRAGTANIRAEPKTSAAIVGRARRGESLLVLARGAGWVQVDAGGSTGWIHADLVEMD